MLTIGSYKDAASADKHTKEPHFQELFATATNEQLLSKPPYIAKTKFVTGFDSDRKLM